jgi:hypothetical protein
MKNIKTKILFWLSVGIYWVFFGIAKADAFEWGFDATW